MTDWNEETLRAAASWKAFKEGKSLMEAGAVVDAKEGKGGWQGAVRMGKRLMRVSVSAKSATDLETRCGCPENQRTGEVCAHAVAVGLAAKAGKKKEEAKADGSGGAAPGNTAWQVVLPEQWRQALVRGRLAANLIELAGEEISEGDERLSGWIAREAGASKEKMAVHIDGARLESFLDAVSGHPRVVSGSKGENVSFESGGRMELAEVERQGDGVRLAAAEGGREWSFVGGAFRRIGEGGVVRMGEGEIPGMLKALLALLAQGDEPVVPLRDFLANLEAWQEWLHFGPAPWIDSIHFVPASPVFELSLEGSLRSLSASLLVRYGDSPPVRPGEGGVPELPRLEGDVCHVRNLSTEGEAVRRLGRAGFQKANDSSERWILDGEAGVLDFVARVLPGIRAEWTVKESGRPLSSQIVVVNPKIEILGSGEDWLGFDLKFQTSDGSLVSTEEVRRLLASGKKVGSGSGGRKVVIAHEVEQLIQPLFSEIDLRQEKGHFVASARSGEIIQEIRKKIDQRSKDQFVAKKYEFELPDSLRAELRPYQTEGAGWMLDRVERYGGAVLADDMGLGKTIQTIALIERLLEKESGVVMVVATASLLGNWRAEFERFAPSRGVRILHGAGRDEEREKVRPGEVVITSYGTLARDLAWHLKREYRAVVVDEASLMRNPDTDHAKAVSKLKAAARIALTGTPVENGVRDLWSIFRFVQPGWLGGREEFRERYEIPAASGEFAGSVMERLRLRTSPFLLRRTKEQVAPELPSKIMIDEFCELSEDQRAVYKELLVEGRKKVDAIADAGNAGATRMQMLTALLRLRQTCCDLALLGNERFNQLLVPRRSAKLQRLLELMEEAISGNHRMLVFSQFRSQLLEIQKCVEERGWGCLKLDGQTRNRQQLVDSFQQSDGPPVFLISLKAGGYGLNLTAADTVVHFDPWWNPAAEAQATDRAHRIGQSRPVTVYRLLARGTVEEKVVRLQERKRELAAVIDENGFGEGAGWSMEELASVIRG